MMVNALNSGADGVMACFEDATAPTVENLVADQRNVHDAVCGTLTMTTPEVAGKRWRVTAQYRTCVRGACISTSRPFRSTEAR